MVPQTLEPRQEAEQYRGCNGRRSAPREPPVDPDEGTARFGAHWLSRDRRQEASLQLWGDWRRGQTPQFGLQRALGAVASGGILPGHGGSPLPKGVAAAVP